MAFAVTERLDTIQFVNPIQFSVAQALTAQANRLLTLNTSARIAPGSGIGSATENLVSAGVGRAIDVRV